MYGVILVVHVLVALFLIGVVLLQGGRGGLSEALGGAAAQSLFGSNAVTVLTRITTFCAAMFVVTCLSLAYLSTVRGRSVIDQIPATLPAGLPMLPSETPALPVESDAPESTPVQPPAAPEVQTPTPSDGASSH